MAADLSPLAPLIRDLGVLTIAAGLIGYIAREAITSYFNKQEQDFQREVDKELQRFQNELDKEIHRVQSELEKEQIVFSGLHEQRAEIVSDFYSKMSEFDQDMRALVNPSFDSNKESMEEQIAIAAESAEEFQRFYSKNKIYFPPEVCETMEDLLDEYREMFHEFSILRLHDRERAAFDPDERLEKWLKNWKDLTKNEIPELREELEDHFRELLGVDTE